MPERYSLKTSSKWFQVFYQIEQARLRLSGTTTTWQVLIELNGNIWCPLVKGYFAFMCDETPFSAVPIHRTEHHKNESWTDGNSLSRKIQMCSYVKCMRVSGNFSLMLSICICHLVIGKIYLPYFTCLVLHLTVSNTRLITMHFTLRLGL